jgi:hypothetical protein
MDLKEWQRRKETVEKLSRDRDRAEGSLTPLLKQLIDEYGAGTTEEAKKILVKLEKEAKLAEQKAEEAWSDFAWKTKLEEE